jgi:hypothetical protein
MLPMHLFCLPGLQHDQRRIAADVSGVFGSIAQSSASSGGARRPARAEYVARSDRQTQAESETVPQAEALPDAEMEL